MRFPSFAFLLLLGCATLAQALDVISITTLKAASEVGPTNGAFKVTRSGSGATLQVYLSLAGTSGGAVAGVDFTVSGATLTDAINQIYRVDYGVTDTSKNVTIVPIVNGAYGAKRLVAAVIYDQGPAPATYIVGSTASAEMLIGDTDATGSILVTRPTAYPTPQTVVSSEPLEIQGRGEWQVGFNVASFRSVEVTISGDPSVGPTAAMDTEYIMGSAGRTIEDTFAADDGDGYRQVVNDSTGKAAAAGDTTICVEAIDIFSPGDIIAVGGPGVSLGYGLDFTGSITSSIYTITAVTAGSTTNPPSITVSKPLLVSTVAATPNAPAAVDKDYRGGTPIFKIAHRVSGTRASFYSGQTEIYFFAFPIHTGIARGRHSIQVDMIQSDDYQVLTPTSGSVVLADDTREIGMSLGANAGKPSTAGYANLILSGPLPQDIDVPFQIITSSGVNAVFNTDYTIDGVDASLLVGSVHVPAGATTAPITIIPKSGGLGTYCESTLRLIPSPDYLMVPTGTSPVNPTAVVSIAPEPLTAGLNPVYVGVTPSAVSVGEGAGTTSFTVRLTNASGAVIPGDTLSTGVVVNYTVSGTATAGADFSPLSGSVAISAGAASATVMVPILQDTAPETGKTIIITLTGAPGYQVSTVNTTTISIVDDDRPYVGIVGPATAGEAAGSAVLTIQVTDAAGVAQPTVGVDGDKVINFTVSGTATPGVDFTSFGGSATIPNGGTAVQVTVPIAVDTTAEGDETVIVTLSPAAGYLVSTAGSTTLTITDGSSSGGGGGLPAPGSVNSGGSAGCGSGAVAILLGLGCMLGLRRRRR
jgi:hypothetical protein